MGATHNFLEGGGHSQRWQVGPRYPGAQVQDPSWGEQVAPLWQEQVMRQPRPQKPCRQPCLHCGPVRRMRHEGQGLKAQRGPLTPWSPPLTCPAGQAAALSGHWIAAVGMGAITPLPAARPECPILGYRSRSGGQCRGWWHQTPAQAAPAHPAGLTGQGCRQRGPCQPGGQLQVPLWGSQAAPWPHSQLRLHLGPQVPAGHGMEQSGPCQPAE